MRSYAFFLALVLLSGDAVAQNAATEKQGFNSKGAFQIGEVDSVSLFTGARTRPRPGAAIAPGWRRPISTTWAAV